MNRFWWRFIWMLMVLIRKYFISISMTSNVIEGNKSSIIKFLFKILVTLFSSSLHIHLWIDLIKNYMIMNANIMNTQIFFYHSNYLSFFSLYLLSLSISLPSLSSLFPLSLSLSLFPLFPLSFSLSLLIFTMYNR